MAVIIPQVITEDKADGAQIIDGGLRFDGSKSHYLKRTPSSTGNRKTWTWSFWTKRTVFGETEALFGAYTDSNNRFYPNFNSDNKLNSFGRTGGSEKISVATNAVFRDTSWYHIVIVLDTTESSSSNKFKYYVNGNLQQTTVSTTPADDIYFNLASVEHRIGDLDSSVFYDGHMSQVYFIDGQALDPSYFGFTDPLTNTWRPKKYKNTTSLPGDSGGVVGFGTNGFWLPLDGNTPIGQDQSGRGNNWTPVNFGGSNTLEKATGALPILNTDGGGKVARVGVRTDSAVGVGTCVLALPLVGIKSDFSNQVDSRSSNKVVTATNAAASSAQSNFYGGSFYFDGTGDYLTVSAHSDLSLTGDFTVELWLYMTATESDERQISSNNYYTVGKNGNWYFGLSKTNGNLVFYTYDGQSNGEGVTVSCSTDLNRWYHIAAVRSGSTVTLYRDGINIGSGTISKQLVDGADGGLAIGKIANTASGSYGDHNGYIQDLRIYKGVAKYTQNFIPASTDPDILPDTPSGVAYSSNVKKITDGAVAFDGSGDYLQLAYNADFDLGNSNFTIEAYARTTDTATNYPSIIGRWQGAGAACWDFRPQSTDANDNFFFIYNDGSSNITVDSGAFVCDGSWHHLAVTRSGTNLYMFVDGILVKTHSIGSTTIFNNVSVPLYIGYDPYGSSYYNGFTSNLHLVKGTALYTSNFIPPTAPITSVANTKLLCCKSNSSARAFSNVPGNGVIYSDYATGNNASNDVRNVFNTNTSDTIGVYTTRSFVFTPPTPISYSSSIKVQVNTGDGSPMAFNVNGAGFGSYNLYNGVQEVTVVSGSGTLSSLAIAVNAGGGADFYYIKVDGNVLYDPISVFGNAAASNFNPFNTDINTQRGQESGYATMSPLFLPDGHTFSNGNLTVTTSTGAHQAICADVAISSGKWYWEYSWISGPSGNLTGIWKTNVYTLDTYLGGTSSSYSYYSDGTKYNNNSASSYGSSWTTSDVIGNAFDADNGTITFYKNGISQGVAYSSIPVGINTSYFPAFSKDTAGTNTTTASLNFGQKPFKFPPPDGFQPLTLANTPRPTIVRPDQYVGIVTYTGNGASGRKVSGYNFKPDLIWIKRRDSSAGHIIQDTIRGSSVYLGSDSTAGDSTTGGSGSSSAAVQFFDSNGFTLGTGTGVNASGGTYVGWCWKAGGNSNTFNINDIGYSTASAAGLTAGTITPTDASVNTKSGFSIIRYTGTGSAATISHGLQNTPQFLIVKRTDTTDRYWMVYHTSTGNTNRLLLNDTVAVAANSAYWNNTSPTSSVFSLGADPGNFSNSTNASGGTYIAYLWAEIPGFSKFGSYAGNSSSDGPVVVTGFKPKYILIKCSSSDQSGNAHWVLFDSERSKFNVSSNAILCNLSDREYTSADGVVGIDILSNGFKLRDSNTSRNGSGTFIYAAFAESPSFNLYGGQSNAR